jgi:hypothetical protein
MQTHSMGKPARRIGRHLAQAALALACGLAPAMAFSQPAAADSRTTAFVAAMAAYESNHWPQAFAALSTLADQGHAEAQRVALLMWRHSMALYGTKFDASAAQRQQWAQGQRLLTAGC